MNPRMMLLAVVPCAALQAEVILPKILSSHNGGGAESAGACMGIATPGEELAVTFRGETRSTKAGQLGRWSVYLSPGAAGGPFEMTVKGTAAGGNGDEAATQTVTLEDVLVGDVWVASGQSNMEFMMRQSATAEADLPHPADPNIRLLVVKKKSINFPQDDVKTTGWTASSPESAKDFSAVGGTLPARLRRGSMCRWA